MTRNLLSWIMRRENLMIWLFFNWIFEKVTPGQNLKLWNATLIMTFRRTRKGQSKLQDTLIQTKIFKMIRGK
jgi:hypothetical protein